MASLVNSKALAGVLLAVVVEKNSVPNVKLCQGANTTYTLFQLSMPEVHVGVPARTLYAVAVAVLGMPYKNV